jgi:hypothetical protein
MSWPKIERFKKHKALAHCKDVPNSIVSLILIALIALLSVAALSLLGSGIVS